MKTIIYLNIIHHQINGVSYQLGWYYLKSIGNDDEYCSKDQMPFVLEEIFIEIPEFFHPGLSSTDAKVLVFVCKSNYKKWFKQWRFL